MCLTNKEIKDLQKSLWLTNKHIIFIDNYIKKQKEWEWMDKETALIEILWLESYSKYKQYIDQADDPANAGICAESISLFE